MTQRRALRSSSRRVTPTITAATPQPTRASRRRATRSASRDIAHRSPSPARHVRGSDRRAHAPTVPPRQQDNGPQSHVAKEELLGDLSTVEEAESHMDLEAVPQSTPRRRPDKSHASPDQFSQISGTTAVTSFSMSEAQRLDAEDIQESIQDLYDASTNFLQFLLLDDGGNRIQELRKPGSSTSKRFGRLERALDDQLAQFRTEGEEYIHLRAVRRALHRDRDHNAPLLGADLIMYLANLLIFVKRMVTSDITSEKGSREMFDALRPLDRHFPSYLLPEVTDLAPGAAVKGESALVDPTIDLALEIRTQLAILVLKRSWPEPDYNPEFSIREVFYQKEEEELTSALRGWHVPRLRAEHLSDHARARVEARVGRMVELVASGGFEMLELEFPWESVMSHVLGWARVRHRELQAMIARVGGIEQICDIAMGKTEPLRCEIALSSQRFPRRSRTSFTKEQRRHSGRLSRGGPVKEDILGALLSMPRVIQYFGGVRSTGPNPPADSQARAAAPNDGWRVQSVLTDADRTLVNDNDNDMTMTETETLAPVADDAVLPPQGDGAEEELRESIEGEGAPSAGKGPSRRHGRSGPPQSISDLVKLIKQTRNKGKENGGDFFARQVTAQRIEFGDGFEGEASQPIPGPSRKEKESVLATKRKRRMFEEDGEGGEDEEEAFETRQSDGRAAERRREAPVAKKVRLELPSSGAPPRHQPPATRRVQQEDNVSGREAPEMTEEAPAAPYAHAQSLARQNARVVRQGEGRKLRVKWTPEETAAFEEYMALFPHRWAEILEYDKTEGRMALQNRDQGNLKDKARNMAITYIKSGAGLPSGFEGIIKPTSKDGAKLLADGFQW